MKKVLIISTILCFLILGTKFYINYSNKENLYSTTNKVAISHYEKGVKYSLMFYAADARKEFKKSIECDPHFPLPYIYLIMLSMEKSGKGITNYYKKIAVPGKNWTEFEKAIVSLFLEFTGKREKIRGNKKFAKKVRDTIEKYANHVEIYPILLPMYQLAIGDQDNLLKYFEYLHKKFPNNTQIINRLGYMYLQKRNYKKAEYYFKEYIFVEPENANPYDSIADLYYSIGEFEKAAGYYKKALSIKPDFFNSRIKLSLCYIFTGKLKKAVKNLELIEKSENNIRVLNNIVLSLKGLAYFLGENGEELKKLYNENKNRNTCFILPLKIYYSIYFKKQKNLDETLKLSQNCPKFIKEMTFQSKLINLMWSGKKIEAEKLCNYIIKRFPDFTYDKKIIYGFTAVKYLISQRNYKKALDFSTQFKEREKTYIQFLIAKKRNDKKKCLEFAKKLIQYYNDSDKNFYIKKEALECLKK